TTSWGPGASFTRDTLHLAVTGPYALTWNVNGSRPMSRDAGSTTLEWPVLVRSTHDAWPVVSKRYGSVGVYRPVRFSPSAHRYENAAPAWDPAAKFATNVVSTSLVPRSQHFTSTFSSAPLGCQRTTAQKLALAPYAVACA